MPFLGFVPFLTCVFDSCWIRCQFLPCFVFPSFCSCVCVEFVLMLDAIEAKTDVGHSSCRLSSSKSHVKITHCTCVLELSLTAWRLRILC
jgi:hypothetical protein